MAAAKAAAAAAPLEVPNDASIAGVTLHAERTTWERHDLLAIVAAACAVASLGLYDADLYFWHCALGLPLAAAAAALLQLATVWSVPWKARSRFLARPLGTATHARVIPAASAHAGRQELVPLERGPGGALRFHYQKFKYTFDRDEGVFRLLEFPLDGPLSAYVSSRGVTPDREAALRDEYGMNAFDIPLPTFGELFKEHAAAPFFVFQMFCVLLWCLDEYWYYSLMTLAMLVLFESTVVQRRLRHLAEMREMRVPPQPVQACRGGKWQTVMTDHLLPGDLVALSAAAGAGKPGAGAGKGGSGGGGSGLEAAVPCDVLLLAGSCVVNEALLTGESKPQVKEGVAGLAQSRRLDIVAEHRARVVWGGTRVLQHSPPPPEELARLSVRAPPGRAAVGYVLRTGFHTGQGRLVRTILFSTQRVSVNNWESLLFIAFLLVFAVAASAYVLLRGLEDPTRSRYKLVLNCVMIITSVVPPELPMELSLAVNTSLMQLSRHAIYCTEPFRIPLAGAVDVCCFDKTGTLTSDQFVVLGVAPPAGGAALVPAAEAPPEARVVLGGCHSLVRAGDGGDGELLGDPLESAAMAAIGWTFSRGGSSSSRDGATCVRLVHRFPFSSALKRMSCVVAVRRGAGAAAVEETWVVAKGAPEVMARLFAGGPPGDDYDEAHRQHSRRGCRVLALGYRRVDTGGASPTRLRAMCLEEGARERFEGGLTPAGHLVLQCPVKETSAETVRALRESSHRVVMITGDHTLTACHVATVTGIATRPVLILTERHGAAGLVEEEEGEEADAGAAGGGGGDGSGVVEWESADGSERVPFDGSEEAVRGLARGRDLCVSGMVMRSLLAGGRLSEEALGRLVRHVAVFARTSPEQKEFVLAWLKRSGFTTLMCGDGTNDVGALKQAHVGLALIGNEADGPNPAKALRAAASRRRRPAAPAAPAPRTREERAAALRKRLEQEMAAADDGPQTVRLGDASIASPFTSKVPFINSSLHVIRQGRCTLVTTMQVFKILALNSLMSAYSMSVLYLDGVKWGDAQATVAGLTIAMFFFFVSRSTPLKRLSAERPHSRLFTVNMLLSVMGQFALHLYVLVEAVRMSKPHTPTDEETVDPEAEFKPNVLNSAVFLVSIASTVATFLANYRGRPFMTGLRENAPLFKSLVCTDLLIFALALNSFPPLNDMLQIAPLPSEDFRQQLVTLLVVDLIGSYAWSKGIQRLFRR